MEKLEITGDGTVTKDGKFVPDDYVPASDKRVDEAFTRITKLDANVNGRIDAHCETFANYNRRMAAVEREVRVLQFCVLMLSVSVYLLVRELYAVPEVAEVPK